MQSRRCVCPTPPRPRSKGILGDRERCHCVEPRHSVRQRLHRCVQGTCLVDGSLGHPSPNVVYFRLVQLNFGMLRRRYRVHQRQTVQRAAYIDTIRSTGDSTEVREFDSIVAAQAAITLALRFVIEIVERGLADGIRAHEVFRRLPECYHGDNYWSRYLKHSRTTILLGTSSESETSDITS